MNKDTVGLVRYLIISVVEALLPLVCFGMFCFGLGLSESDLIIPNFIAIIGIIIFCLIPIMYFILPIIVTILAIRNHWSIYLDKFFNQLKLPTFVFLIVFILLLFFDNAHKNMEYSNVYNIYGYLLAVYYSFIPPYCLIYIVILVHNIFRKYSNKRKKLKDFINKFRGMS